MTPSARTTRPRFGSGAIQRVLIAIGGVIPAALILLVLGRAREEARASDLTGRLLQGASRPLPGSLHFESLTALPPPVHRYLRHVLRAGQEPIRTATLRQSGLLRTSAQSRRWSWFTATEWIVPPATGFVWDAHVGLPLGAHVRVLDSYIDGVGGGRVSLLSAIPLAAETSTPELTSGALHRYLAEAVWVPTALLPQSGVIWTPIDDRTALATLSASATTVSLEFRFSEQNEVASIYSPARFGNFDGEYRQLPWEGHFRDYQPRSGMLVPLYGEVGWYVDGALRIVWQGEIDDLTYELGSGEVLPPPPPTADG